jgi:hypothetical protein
MPDMVLRRGTDVGFPELNDVVSSQRSVVVPPGMPPGIKKIRAGALQNALADKEFLAWTRRGK